MKNTFNHVHSGQRFAAFHYDFVSDATDDNEITKKILSFVISQ